MPELSPDGLTYTFTIKPGFKFSPPSTEEITAETYRYSMERALSGDLGDQGRRAIDVWSDIAGAQDFHDGKADHVTGLAAVGDQLMVTLTAPSNDFLQRLMLPYSCPVPSGTPIVPSLDPTTPVPTSGPYYLAAHGGGEYAILKPNPNYGGSRQTGYDAIVLRFGLSDGDTVQYVNNGQAGMAIGSTAIQPTSVASSTWGPDSENAVSGDQRWYGIPYPGVDHLLLNPNGKLTSDPVVRRAIALALDRAAAGQSFFEPPATTILNKSVAIQDPEATDLIGPDAATAKADLAGRSGTIRFAISKNCSACLDSANSIKSNLAAVGLTLEIVPEDSPFDAAVDPRQRIDMIENYAQPFYPDAAQLVDDIVSGAPQGWFNAAQQQQAASLLALAGTARDQGAADFAQQLTSDATVIPYGGSIDGVYFSPSVGCRTIIAGIMNVDLTALCPASP
jgi:ABC-type oligopeptide transport system substrate-binding subunit